MTRANQQSHTTYAINKRTNPKGGYLPDIRLLFMSSYLPLSLLAILFAVAFATVFVQADSYGITIDDAFQDSYGRSTLSWYQTQGRDQSFLYDLPGLHMPEHGAIFEVIVALAQQTFGEPRHTRAVVTGLAGVVGVLAIALCGFELGNWWGALLAALGLWLYPRFFGAIFNNSKDIPFTSATVLVLWTVLLLVRRWDMKWRYLISNNILVGFLIGFAISIRISALFWYPVLLVLLAGWWIGYGSRAIKEKTVVDNLVKQASSCLIIVTVSFITIVALWPYIALDPVHNFYHSYIINSKYPVPLLILFQGKIYPNAMVPRNYVPVWLVIGSPPAVVFLAAIGGLIACLKVFKREAIKIPVVVIGLALLIPLAMLVILSPVLYDGMRQFLFLVPSLILLAVYGLMNLASYLVQKKQKLIMAGLAVIVLATQLQVIKDMNDMHPYEYMYFSPLIGGISGAKRQYEMDYWGICNKPAAEWLARNYRKYTTHQFPTAATWFSSKQITPYLPEEFEIDLNTPDFYISTTRFGLENKFPSYKIIHTEGVQSYVTCVVKAKPSY